MKTKDIHELSEIEVEKKLRDTRDEHVKMRMSKQTGQVEETHKLKNLRRDIARLETILKEKKLASTSA
ncbi:MAG: 50S ribosomal protein L29 [Puniceicoccaceae bacterium MED-G32]|jgi:large subunit ribosomal protein L29|nr:50S ribosomal protein L29 [Puniceicoccaceae bacterium]PDH27305.1 MAG: 50S ribosomal protein L29 [Puniceicoccaceae bacterium MED-G32]CAI8260641.1 MAG: 50S ribosomal protein L29 [Puniceicoccaceae bacterium MED-G32]|tara:strand:+ start:5169 stop:5372 length:204 start_codon:yes stop_codon:yes gene_type:complete